MAVFDTNRSYEQARFWGRVGAVLANVYATLVDWNDARLTRKSLSSLSDRELDDIGLVRGDIELVAQGKRRL